MEGAGATFLTHEIPGASAFRCYRGLLAVAQR